ncbi:MAG: PhnD/SsuA/transferrin family substrate-binding protein [Pseudomonadota bacterium]
MPINRLSSMSLGFTIGAGICVLLPLGSSIALSSEIEEWRAETTIFKVGVVTGGDPLREKRLSQFGGYIQSALNMPVDVFYAADTQRLIDAIAADQIDYAVMTGLSFAATQKLCSCVRAIASPSTIDGKTHIASVLLSPSSRQFEDIKRVITGPSTDFSTHQVPKLAFETLVPDMTFDERHSLSAVLADLEIGDGQSVFAWTFTTVEQADPGGMNLSGFAENVQQKLPDRSVKWMSQPYRLGPHVVHQTVPLEIRTKLTAALASIREDSPLAFDAVSPMFGGPFVVADNAEYGNYSVLLDGFEESVD